MSRIVVIDTETTGVSHSSGHRVIELAAVEIVDGKLSKKNYFHSLINPEGRKISPGSRKVHGIRDQDLQQSPTFADIAESFLDFISGAELSTYNLDFDLGFLQAELDRAGLDVVLRRDFKCSCLMKSIANGGKWLKLDAACRRYSIDISLRKVHGALIDAQLAAELYIRHHLTEQVPLQVTPQLNKHTAPVAFPIPRAFRHPESNEMVQLNYCKNPNCDNYGVPAKNPLKNKDGTPKRGLANDYKLTTTRSGKSLTCKLCKTSTRLINNRAYVLESIRINNEHSLLSASCPNESIIKGRGKGKPCKNFSKEIHNYPDNYIKKGINYSKVAGYEHKGTQRIECKACGKQFNVAIDPQVGQQNHQINEALFSLLINKGVINRIQESLGINAPLIYQRIEFFYQQCIQFEQWHIKENIHRLQNKSLEISMDRQHYLANWSEKKDRRPTKLVNTSSVDNNSRYVLASTVNFDFTSDWQAIKKDFKKRKESFKPIHERIYSQYVVSDSDVESDDVEDALPLKAPSKHLLVQQTYSLMAHLAQVKKFYDSANHVDLFADDDEGFELGICLTLNKLIKSGKVYPVLIRADRNNASQMQDRRTWSEQVLIEEGFSELEIKNAQNNQDDLNKLAHKYFSASLIQRNENIGNSKSEWLVHPFPKYRQTMDIKPLVLPDGEISQELSESLSDVSTHGVDNFFQMIRRRINMLERPITSATNGLRWNGYASYNPKWAAMLIEIFRVYSNYVLTDKKTLMNKKSKRTPKTPAQKLGLADAGYSIGDILSFSVISSSKFKN
ncbi:exonuclease domain-containing protein [Thalassotalea litorea]|uniref:exonuclease domain-containing protein n=1 Tax=Thalassotalea litorea TaxID=2020715 RepID=UPI003734D71A